MAKFYTCRAVVNPSSAVPSVRLCLRPTVDGLNCAQHAGKGHGLAVDLPEGRPVVMSLSKNLGPLPGHVCKKSVADPSKSVTAAISTADQAPEKANEGAKAPEVTKHHAPACRRCEHDAALNEKGYCAECQARVSFWPK